MNLNLIEQGPFCALHAPAGAIDCNILARPHLLALWAELASPAELPTLPEPEIGGREATHSWAARVAVLLDAFMAQRNADESSAVRWYAHACQNEVRLTRRLKPDAELLPHERECIEHGDCRHTLELQVVMLPMRLLVHWNTGTGLQDPVHFPLATRLGPHWPGIVAWPDSGSQGTTTVVIRGAEGRLLEPTGCRRPALWELSNAQGRLRWNAAAGGIVPLRNETADLAVTLPRALALHSAQIATAYGWEILPSPWNRDLRD